MYRIIIWGTQIEYDKYLTLFQLYEGQGVICVVGVTSNDNYYTKLDNYTFIPKEKLLFLEYDYIVICAETKLEAFSIRRECILMGINEDVLLSAHILQLPYFNFKRYIELLESKPSILSNNCWGGVVYKRLGLKARSPFYNMFEIDKEWVLFLKNAKQTLLNSKLCFKEMRYNQEEAFDYPTYLLDEMCIYMNHYSDRREAERKWYERLARINWNNLFVMMYSDNVNCIEEFSCLPYKKKICFTSLNVNIPFSYCLPINEVCPNRPLWHIVLGSAEGLYKLYDLMELLLTGEIVNKRIQL